MPDSCCDEASVAAQRIKCISHVPFGEALKLTAYKAGCVPTLVKFYGSMLNIRAAMMIGIAMIEGAVVVIVVLEVRRESAASEKEKNETNKLLQKKKSGEGIGAKSGGDKKAPEGKAAPAEDTAEAAAPGYPPGYPGAPGYGAVPGYGGPAYNMYYGHQ